MPKENCFHCGTACNTDKIEFDDKLFCCNGCKTVYEILNQNELTCYYDLGKTPGSIPKEIKGKYDYLNNEEIANLKDDELAHIRNKQIGFVFQTFNLMPRATAFHNVELPLIYNGTSKEDRDEKTKNFFDK